MIDRLTGALDMHIKLRQPPSYGTTRIVLPVSGEVHYSPRPPAALETINAYAEQLLGEGLNVLQHIIWTDRVEAYAEVRVRTARGEPMTVILTNWDAWVGNQFGATIDRIHRFGPA